MERGTISELRCREVINICSGDRLGFVSDIQLDLCSGQAKAIVVPGKARYFGLIGRDEDYIIPWGAIRSIGEDLILVELPELWKDNCVEQSRSSEKNHWR